MADLIRAYSSGSTLHSGYPDGDELLRSTGYSGILVWSDLDREEGEELDLLWDESFEEDVAMLLASGSSRSRQTLRVGRCAGWCRMHLRCGSTSLASPKISTNCMFVSIAWHSDRNQGRWKEAEDLEARVVETSRTLLGVQHLSTLTSMGNLAPTYRHQERGAEAEKLNMQGGKDKDTSASSRASVHADEHGHLALICGDQEQWKEAEELELKAMETPTIVLGAGNSSTLESMSNLASTYGKQGG
nr:kinesin light chain 1 [Quercus suber]